MDPLGKKELLDLQDTIKLLIENNDSNRNNLIKTWLLACLSKTIKENINISMQIVCT